MNMEKIRHACMAALPGYHVEAPTRGHRFYAYPGTLGHSFMAQVDADRLVWGVEVSFDAECGEDFVLVDVDELGAILDDARAFRVALQAALDADKAGDAQCSE